MSILTLSLKAFFRFAIKAVKDRQTDGRTYVQTYIHTYEGANV